MAENSIIKPFKVNLHYSALDGSFNPGIVLTIANMLNGIQDGILFEDKKEIGFSLKGKKPYSNNSIEFHERRNSELSIIFSPIEIDQKFLLLDRQRNFAIISNKFIPTDSEVKLSDFFAYYTIVAILGYYVMSLVHHGEQTECPFDNNPSPAKIRTILKRGHLCQICEGKINSFKQKEELPFSFFESIGKIQNAIAQKYIQEDKLSKSGKTRFAHTVDLQYAPGHPNAQESQMLTQENKQEEIDQANVSKKEQIDIGLQFEADIQKPDKPDRTASTGKYNIANDDENPVDSLGYEAYADAFADIIMDENTKTPFTIGICGQWGRGKTVLLNYIKARIVKKSGNDKIGCQCIQFNAWKYSEAKQIWAEFYTTVINDIESNMNIWQRLLFKKYVFEKANKLLYRILQISLIIALISIGLMSWISFCSPQLYIQLTRFPAQAIVIYGMVSSGIIFPIIIYIWKYFRLLSKQVFFKSRRPTFKDALGIQHEIFKYIDFIIGWLKNHAPRRVVVIIDDIDRCEANQIMQMFESIKQFLDSERFVFLLGMDAKIAIKAIGNHYDFMEDDKHEKECLGKLYLDKIIQIPFQLPQPDSDLLNKLCDEVLKDYIKMASDKIDKKPEEEKGNNFTNNNAEENKDINGNNKKYTSQSKAEVTPDKNKEEQDKKIKLRQYEIDTIKEILKIEDINFSPRLLKRFINIYLIARHIYIEARFGENNTSEAPNPGFIKWMALSVLYPHESAALYKWLKINNYDNPIQDYNRTNPVFNDNIGGKFLNNANNGILLPDTPFYNLNKKRLDEFGKIYCELNIEARALCGADRIFNLFNLVLD